jgi:hypothetical protein
MEYKIRQKTSAPGIYVASLWSLTRGILPILALMGQYNIDRTFTAQITGTPLTPEFNTDLFISWLLSSNIATYIALILSLAFLVVSIGIVFGENWSRLLFLILSAVMVFWNLRAISWGNYSLPFYSLVALGFANWYFRQPKILSFFNAIDISPSIFRTRLRGVALDLLISTILFLILVVYEAIGVAIIISR